MYFKKIEKEVQYKPKESRRKDVLERTETNKIENTHYRVSGKPKIDVFKKSNKINKHMMRPIERIVITRIPNTRTGHSKSYKY